MIACRAIIYRIRRAGKDNEFGVNCEKNRNNPERKKLGYRFWWFHQGERNDNTDDCKHKNIGEHTHV